MAEAATEMRLLRRDIANFRPRTELVISDASWITRALEAEAELASLKSQPAAKADRKRHPTIVYAEAHLLFGAYVDAELERLGDKLSALEAGTLDGDADLAWKQRNERVAASAIDREAEAYRLAEARQDSIVEQGEMFAGAAA